LVGFRQRVRRRLKFRLSQGLKFKNVDDVVLHRGYLIAFVASTLFEFRARLSL
jgi:hypothetical protein